MRIKTLLITAIASILLATAPAKATLIQTFTCNAVTFFSCSGDVVFDGAGGISDLDISGVAWGQAYSFTDITGIATLDATWNVVSWNWSFGAAIGTLTEGILLDLIGIGPGDIAAVCGTGRGGLGVGCGGSMSGSVNVGLIFIDAVPVPEPGSFGLLTVGLAGLLFFWRRRPAKGTA